MTLVSVITPAHNSVNTLQSAVQSVLDQTYTCFELIIIDDASSDSTASLIDHLIQSDNRIRSYSFPYNVGASVARNKAIEMSRGNFVAFLDSDDLWLPTKLEEMLLFFMESRINYPHTPFVFSSYIQSWTSESRPDKTVIPPSSLTFKQLVRSNCVCTSTVLFYQDLSAKKYMPNYVQVQDWAFWLFLLGSNSDVLPMAFSLNRPLSIRIHRHGSLSKNFLKATFFKYLVLKEVAGLPLFRCVYSLSFHFVIAFFKRYSNLYV